MHAEMVSPQQTTFMPLKFILDNVFVAYEVIDIAKGPKQSLLFFKVDFRKAFDNVRWEFIFKDHILKLRLL